MKRLWSDGLGRQDRYRARGRDDARRRLGHRRRQMFEQPGQERDRLECQLLMWALGKLGESHRQVGEEAVLHDLAEMVGVYLPEEVEGHRGYALCSRLEDGVNCCVRSSNADK